MKKIAYEKSLEYCNPELAKEWHPTKNENLTPADVTACSGKKVWWFLPYDDPATGKHFDFEWEASITNRTNLKRNCPFLCGRSVWPGYNDLVTTHPQLAGEWHPTKNGELTPNEVSRGYTKKIWWYLSYDDPATEKHFNFEWEATVNNRVSGQGCPFLTGKAVWKGFNDLCSTDPKRAKLWHPTLNGSLEPCNITRNSRLEVWWLYPYDDPATGNHFDFEWKDKVYNAIKFDECPFITNQRVWYGYNDLFTLEPEVAAMWHPTKNGELTSKEITCGSNKKVWWYLPYDDPKTGKHFDFEWFNSVYEQVKHNVCPFLKNFLAWSGFNDLASNYPLLAEEWHPTKNKKIKPETVTIGYTKPVWWYLPYDDPKTGKHFEFEWSARITDRIRDKLGCPFLSNSKVWLGYNDLKTTHPQIAALWHPAKNGSKTPENYVAGSDKKIWWYLPYDDPKTGKHFDFEWKTAIRKVASGDGKCPYFSNRLIWPGYNDFATKAKDLALEWHPQKNRLIKPEKISKYSEKKVWWLCSLCGHEWRQSVIQRTYGSGCPNCTKMKK